MDRALAELVWARAFLRCEYCLMPQQVEMWSLEIDHIVARSHGGATASDNLALACFYCNNYKGSNLSGIDPDTQNVVRLFHPRRQVWRRHFRYIGPILVGRTAAARATVVTLRINLPIRVSLREALLTDGTLTIE